MEVKIIGNIVNNIVKGIEEGYSLVALQGSARSGKTRNTIIFIIMCCQNPNIVNQMMLKYYPKALERWEDAVRRGIIDDEDKEKRKPTKPEPVSKVRVSLVRGSLPETFCI